MLHMPRTQTNPVCQVEGTAPLLKLPLQRRGSDTAGWCLLCTEALPITESGVNAGTLITCALGGVYVYQHNAVSIRRQELAHFFAGVFVCCYSRPFIAHNTRNAPGHVSAIRKDLSKEVRARCYCRVL